jgi:hypothetical protein
VGRKISDVSDRGTSGGHLPVLSERLWMPIMATDH